MHSEQRHPVKDGECSTTSGDKNIVAFPFKVGSTLRAGHAANKAIKNLHTDLQLGHNSAAKLHREPGESSNYFAKFCSWASNNRE
jgi:hypothetical protein